MNGRVGNGPASSEERPRFRRLVATLGHVASRRVVPVLLQTARSPSSVHIAHHRSELLTQPLLPSQCVEQVLEVEVDAKHNVVHAGNAALLLVTVQRSNLAAVTRRRRRFSRCQQRLPFVARIPSILLRTIRDLLAHLGAAGPRALRSTTSGFLVLVSAGETTRRHVGDGGRALELFAEAVVALQAHASGIGRCRRHGRKAEGYDVEAEKRERRGSTNREPSH